MVGWWFRLMGMDGKERKNISRLEQNKTKIKDTTASRHHIHDIESENIKGEGSKLSFLKL